jgi:hypothetical protein
LVRGGTALDDLDVEMTMVGRLVRAHENLALAAKLRKSDAPAYARFMKFVACERTVPPLAPGDAIAR